jgi:hypothetical protein
MSDDENHGPEHILYDDFQGSMDDLKSLGQSITDLYKNIGITDRDYKIENIYIPDSTVEEAITNVPQECKDISKTIFEFIGLEDAQKLLASLYDSIKNIKEETNSLTTETDGGVYNHEPQEVLDTAGDPWSNMMEYILPVTSYGYNNSIGYQLTNQVNNLVKCLAQDAVLSLSTGRWMLVTGTFSPLFPYVPTSFPTTEYTATVDGRPEYIIDRGGGVKRTDTPPDVYPYKPIEEIQPSEQLIVQDEYQEVLKALKNV